MKALWVFDLDGTLVTSNIDYGYAIVDFVKLMLDVFEHKAPHYSKIIEIENKVDRERFKIMKAARNRFPGSLVETYQEICLRAGVRWDPAIENQVWEIGYSALSEETYQNRAMIQDSEKVLEFLLSQEGEIFCVTAGDPEVQWMKWHGYNLQRFFPSQREFRVVKWEKLPTLRKLRSLYPNLPAVMIGDSVGSDMVPADVAGYLPIYIPPARVWDHGELVEELPGRTRKFEKISQIRTKYWDLIMSAERTD